MRDQNVFSANPHPPSASFQQLKISLFGPVTAELQGKSRPFRSNKVRALLAYLATHPNYPHARQSLVTLLWGEQPEKKALTNFRSALSQLRNTLGEFADTLLEVTTQTVQFNLNPQLVWVDTSDFVAHWQVIQRYPAPELWRRAAVIPHLYQALACGQDEFLSGLLLDDSPAFEEWRLTQAEQYRQQLLIILEALAQHHLALQSPYEALTYSQRQLTLEPWHEVAHRQVMQAQLMLGQWQLALNQYEHCRQLLYEQLAIEPTAETTELYKQIKTKRGRTVASPSVHNRPPTPTPFIGRQHIITRLLPLLLDPDYRLLTLSGSGGVGKTRLALELASKMTNYFREGGYFVPLAPVMEQESDPNATIEAIATAIARALRLPLSGQSTVQAQLLTYLKRRELLLLLDNFEHLQVGTPLVQTILTECSAVQILVTSRIRLNLQSEYHAPLSGLEISNGHQPAEAVQLFHERAERVDFNFRPTVENRPLVTELCQFLDGVPLSLELAAGWIDRLPLSEVVAIIARDLDKLATTMADIPERQRSLRAVFAGSWRLLSDREQTVLAQLAIFRGGAHLAAISTIIGAESAVLSTLVAHFLLRQPEETVNRYDLHELLRQFSLEQLTALGIRPETEAAHGRYYLALVTKHDATLRQGNWPAIRDKLEADLGNIRQAWEWAVETAAWEPITAAYQSYYHLYLSANLFLEGEQLFGRAAERLEQWLSTTPAADGQTIQQTQQLLNDLLLVRVEFLTKLSRGQEAAPLLPEMLRRAEQLDNRPQQAAILLRWGLVHISLSEYAAAQPKLLQAQELAEALTDDNILAESLVNQGLLAWFKGDNGLARELCQGGLYISTKAGNKRIEVISHILLGLIGLNLGLYDEALKSNAAAITAAQALSDRYWEGVARNNIGVIYVSLGEFKKALPHFEESLSLRRATGYLLGESSTLGNLGNAVRCLGDFPRAQAYLEEALQIQQEINDTNGQAWSLHKLGVLAWQMGQQVEAADYNQQALTIWRQNDDRQGIAVALCALGRGFLMHTNYAQATTYLTEGLQAAERADHRDTRAIAHHNLGILACEQQAYAEAAKHFQQALTLRRKLGTQHAIMESQAWLVWVMALHDESTTAGAKISDVASFLEADKGVMGMERPFRIFYICYKLLQKTDSARAIKLLMQAYQHLQTQSAKITDSTQSQMFLQQVPDHQLIAREVAGIRTLK